MILKNISSQRIDLNDLRCSIDAGEEIKTERIAKLRFLSLSEDLKRELKNGNLKLLPDRKNQQPQQ